MFPRCLLPAAVTLLTAGQAVTAADTPVVQRVINGRHLSVNLVATREDDKDDKETEKVTEKEIKVENLPPAVKEAIEKKYPDCKILEAEVEVDGDKVLGYEVEITTADGKKLELEVSKDGTKIEVEYDADDADDGDSD